MSYVLLFYGLAFILLGAMLALQARVATPAMPARALWLLAGFGLVHGAGEWTALWIRVHPELDRVLRLLQVSLHAVSFALLLQFGIEGVASYRALPRWLRAIPSVIVVALLAGLAVRDALAAPVGYEVAARYALGLPGSLLASVAVLRAQATSEPGDSFSRHRRVLSRTAAIAFIAYAIFTGLVVPAAPFPPASFLNTETFSAVTHTHIEVWRGLCAATIAYCLSELYVIESSRAQARAERMREEFVSVVAHDLRNVINVIGLTAGMLEPRPPGERDPERERKLVDRVRTASHTLARMVDDLLEASRIEAKRLALKQEKIDLGRLVPEIIERASALTGDHPVKVDLPASGLSLSADPMRFEQILVNLLSNASKYSHPGKEVEVELRQVGGEIVTSVSNVGSPISAENLPRLFDRFYRTSDAAASGTRGLGLGLYIAKGLVEAHGGRIWVESVGESTTFAFAIPCAPRSDRSNMDQQPSAPRLPRPSR